MTRRVEELKFARQSYAVAWRNFLKGFSTDPDSLFCFFEGEDPKYYSIRVDLVARPARYRQFSVGGRKGVLQLLDLILNLSDGRYDAANLAFFVDRDFIRPSVESDLVYVTPCYSIENLYVTRTVFERILASEFMLTQGEPSFESALRFFELSFENFNAAVGLLNGWLRQQRVKEDSAERNGESIVSLELRDVRVWEFVEQMIPQFQTNYSVELLDRRFKRTSNDVDLEQINSWIGDKESVPEMVYRGKFQMDFMYSVLTFLVNDINSKVPKVFLATRKVPLSLQKGNILSQLAQYADTPNSLVDFLDGIRRRLNSPRGSEI